MDEQMNIVKYTDKITNFFDIPEENISNFSTILLNFNVKLPNLLEDIRACVKNGKNITYDVVVDDKTYIFLIRKIYVSSDKNNFIALSFFDKTDIAQKEQILFQQSKMASMGEMIGNIAHQWRQPLNVLSLQIGKVILDYKMKKLNDEIIDNFDKKSTEVIQRMSKTIDDFRNFFRPNKQKQLFKIKDALKDVLLFTKDSYVDNNITLEIEDFDENIVTNGFKNELVQVLLVILNNAKDAIKSAEMKNAKVDIKIGVDKECVSISIQDNGGGIDNDVLPKIFEPYFTTKFESNGTGIGLYMAKMIIETSMKGELKIENSKGGVLVSIKIPKDVSNV
jgi:signal transduction histidine kinase